MDTLLSFLPEIERLGNREAIRFSNGFRTWKLSYRDLYRSIGAFAHTLDEKGLGKGDRLIFWGENRPEWIAAFWGSLARGVEVVPVDARFSPRLVERIQGEVGAKLLVRGPKQAGDNLGVPDLRLDQMENLGRVEDFNFSDVTPDDVVEIVYTSGTTGEPKGVVHRHRHICSNLRMFQREIDKYKKFAFPFQPIRILDLLPLSHLYGQTLGIFFPVLLGSSVVLLSELHPGTVMETIRAERVSVLVAVPRLLANLHREVERRFVLPDGGKARKGLFGALGRWWRYRKVHSGFGWKFWALLVGGASLSPQEEEFWWRLGFVLVQGYGLTETSPIVTTNHPLHPHRGSIGGVIEGQEVKIAPDGEILVRGESVVSEVVGAPSGSATTTPDGWLHTGDIGEMDEEGHLYFRGRKKDVIVTSDGANIYPEDVEAVLNRRPEIKDSVVIGLSAHSNNNDEQVHAVLVLFEPETKIDPIIRQVNAELEAHQRIRGWSVWSGEDFPRTESTFKVKRGEIRKTVSALESGEPGVRLDKDAKGAVAALAGMTGREASDIEDGSRLSEDLGLTSLDRVDLLSRLENESGVELDEERFSRVDTVEDLRAYIQQAEKPELEVPESHSDQMPRWPRRFPVPAIRHAVLGLGVRFLWNRTIDFSVEGLSNLDEVAPPVIFAANHASHLDTIAVLMGLPFRWRRLVTPAMQKEHFRAYFESARFKRKERLWRATQYGLACGLINAYPLPHEMAGVRASLKFTGELAQAGYCPLVYPEGERTADGRMHRFKPGIGLMAVRLRVPVVPIRLEGMFQIYSIHDSWPKTGAVRMRVGAPLHFQEGQDYDEVAARIEAAIQQLRPDGVIPRSYSQSS